MQNLCEIIADLDSPSNINMFINEQFNKSSFDVLLNLFEQMIEIFSPFCKDPKQWISILEKDHCQEEGLRLFPVVNFIMKWVQNFSQFNISTKDIGVIVKAIDQFKDLFEDGDKRFMIENCLFLTSKECELAQEYSLLPTIVECDQLNVCFEMLISCLATFFPCNLTYQQLQILTNLSIYYSNNVEFVKIMSKYGEIVSKEHILTLTIIPEYMIEVFLSRNEIDIDHFLIEKFKSTNSFKQCHKLFLFGSSTVIKESFLLLLEYIYATNFSIDYIQILLEIFHNLPENLQKFSINCFEQAVKLKNDIWRVSIAVFVLSLLSVKYELIAEEKTKSLKKKNSALLLHQLTIRAGLCHAFHNSGYSEHKANIYFLLDAFERNSRCDEIMLNKAISIMETKIFGNSYFDWLLVYKLKEYASKRPTKIDRSWSMVGKVKELIHICNKNVQADVVFNASKFHFNLDVFYEFNRDQDSKLLALVQSRIGQCIKFKQQIKKLLLEN